MDDRDDLKGLWLHLICCGGPIVVFALIGLAPTLIAFVLTYKVWGLAAGVGLALAGALVWWGHVRRLAQPTRHPDPIEPARTGEL